MRKKSISKIITFLCFTLLFSTALNAQVTRSSLNGNLTNGSKAKIKAVHEPSGTIYEVIADNDGAFQLNNLRTGGPYTIYANDQVFESEINLALGQTYTVQNTTVETKNDALSEVVVKTAKNNTYNKGRTGAETTLTSEQLKTLPNVTGGIADFVRITPQARVEDDNIISIAGQNNRYNAVYVDGGVDNDVFGLSANGLDGGQSGGNPFALDELDQISVSPAPFDVKQSGFAGGAINATTKGGSNQFHGSAYYLLRNERFAGKTTEYVEANRKSLSEFTATRFGGSLGGPIIKDKLFFFATFEREDIETPAPFIESTYVGASAGTNLLDQLKTRLGTLGIDPGTYGSINETLKKDIFAGRLDWTINSKHDLSLKYKYISFDNFNAANSSTTTLNYSSYSIQQPSKKHSFSLDWNGRWTNNLTSQLLLTYKTVNDDRDPNANHPTIKLDDGTGFINIGAEEYSTANLLEQNILGAIANIEYKLGKHQFLFGSQYDAYDVTNIFIRNNYGAYRWNDTAGGLTGLQKFLAGQNANQFTRSYSTIAGDTTGDNNTGGAAKFNSSQLGIYLQDQWKATKDLTLTLGLRVDVPFFEATRENAAFNNAIPLFEAAGYDLQGAKTGQALSSSLHFSPRFGFNYRMNNNSEFKTQIRGGVGVFTSRIPLVWIGGSYNNTGNSLAEVTVTNNTTGIAFPFNNDISSNNGLNAANSRPQIDIFAKDFKLPQRLKFSLGLDQKLPYDFNFNLDFQYDDVLNDVYYQNVNQKIVGYYKGADNRPRWSGVSTAPISNLFNDVLLGTNTDEGYAYTISMGINKTFFKKLYFSLGYTYNDAYAINNGTSSQNNSQWNSLPTVSGKNQGELARADYSMGSRVTSLVSYSFDWFKKDASFNTRTKVAIFYEGLQGAPYSYVYNDGNGILLNDDNVSRRRAALFYVPKNISEINLVTATFAGVTYTPAQQWNLLNTYIENDPYLRSRRGEYAERNANRLPWSNVIDLRLQQELDLKVGSKKHTLGLSFDIFNFTNFLNKDWGRRYTDAGLFRGYQLVNVTAVTPNPDGTFSASYTVNPASLNKQTIEAYDNTGIQSSVWQMQVGLKYSF